MTRCYTIVRGGGVQLEDQVALFLEVAVKSPEIEATAEVCDGQALVRFIRFEDGSIHTIVEQSLDALPGSDDALRALFTAGWAWVRSTPLIRMPCDVWDPDLVLAGTTVGTFEALFADQKLLHTHLGKVEGARRGLTLTDAQCELLFRALNPHSDLTGREQLAAVKDWMRQPNELHTPLLEALGEGLDKGWYECWYADAPHHEMSQRILACLAEYPGLQAWLRAR